jgi:hypothetical protein
MTSPTPGAPGASVLPDYVRFRGPRSIPRLTTRATRWRTLPRRPSSRSTGRQPAGPPRRGHQQPSARPARHDHVNVGQYLPSESSEGRRPMIMARRSRRRDPCPRGHSGIRGLLPDRRSTRACPCQSTAGAYPPGRSATLRGRASARCAGRRQWRPHARWHPRNRRDQRPPSSTCGPCPGTRPDVAGEAELVAFTC